jgi:fatty acyl-CoA reductase
MMFTVTDKHQSKMCDRGKLQGHTPEIREFFAGRKVFITGGIGFIGAVLLEKLLRACPEIETVYLLVRPKRKSSVQDRVSTLLDSPVSEVAHRLKHILTKISFAL